MLYTMLFNRFNSFQSTIRPFFVKKNKIVRKSWTNIIIECYSSIQRDVKQIPYLTVKLVPAPLRFE